jgi:LemA protein
MSPSGGASRSVVLIGLFIITRYNRLVTLRERFRNAFAQIDVQLKRRYDLIPNLVEIAKGYMKHERETLEAVIQARNQASQAEKKAADEPGRPGRRWAPSWGPRRP